MKKVLLLLLAIIFLSTGMADAQRWKRQRYELSIGAGVSNFLGELGGANQIGTNYFKDLEWSLTRMAFAAGLRYKLSNYFALTTHLTYGRVTGDDKLTQEYFRNYRNLSFFSDIYEFNVNFEGAFQQEQIGHRYRLRRVRGVRGYELYTYAFVGAGIFHFDPKTIYQGQTLRLQPLGTEGQGLLPSRKKYSLFQFVIPMGVGFKYTIDNTWGVGLEIGIRKTFTDYIDDVSTTYFDFENYPDANPLAAALSDRSNQSNPNITAAREQRGDPRDKDSYMFAIFSINYKLKTGRGRLPRF
ncbi:MAG TPA: outer membrane beta-barrel protein [Bacteroidia bacterium]|nr:outer membrane beta-barrel protein [Bacteroidia bacterium]HNS12450.1 outer membrane beta-barrel protein [Bacteroidia bacterium]